MHTLKVFHKIAALAPSGKKTILDSLPNAVIDVIPHIVEVKPSPFSKTELRKKHSVP